MQQALGDPVAACVPATPTAAAVPLTTGQSGSYIRAPKSFVLIKTWQLRMGVLEAGSHSTAHRASMEGNAARSGAGALICCLARLARAPQACACCPPCRRCCHLCHASVPQAARPSIRCTDVSMALQMRKRPLIVSVLLPAGPVRMDHRSKGCWPGATRLASHAYPRMAPTTMRRDSALAREARFQESAWKICQGREGPD